MEQKTENPNELPFVAHRTLVANGGSIVVTIPPEWLKQNDLKAGDRVILVANGHLTVLKDNPEFISRMKESLTVITPSQ
ncbi:MAG: AbrB/MazE/SpoVT family DNA-binding domain-containing protein [Candidatus Woesearchaeota archaeon]|nr:AbrB/MazE/SpoVT family DNA-binding domain-containing protein [Candidatus Woesearchaeota archaeon]